MKKEKIKIILTSIFSFIISALILSFVIPDVNNKSDMTEIKDKSEVKNKTFAVMLQGEDGYVASEESTWPTSGYTLNEELTNCIDNAGTKIENALNYNNGQVSMKANKNIFCYLYFDLLKDTTKPEISVKVNNNNSTNATVTITSNEDGRYCVNTNADSQSNCLFQGDISLNSQVTTGIFTSSGEYYIHVIDLSNNVATSNKITISLLLSAGDFILSNPSAGLNKNNVYAGLYRYIGTTANNYVKLSDGTNEVLYRIIGVVSSDNNTLGLKAGQLKIIKADSIVTSQWYYSYSSDVAYEDSNLYTYLQGSVIGNTSYVPKGWSSKIKSVKWNCGSVNNSSPSNGDIVYGLEDDLQTTSRVQVGILHLSDYYYAANNGGTINCQTTSCLNWLTDSTKTKWTMASYFGGGLTRYAWYISTTSSGTIGYQRLDKTLDIYPVFYLEKDVYITNSGATGTSTDPFILDY